MAYTTPWLEGKANGLVQVQSNGAWVSLIDPSSMEVETYDLDSGSSTGRNLDGEMLRDRVAVKEKLVMEFPPMWGGDYVQMLALVKEPFFQCKYYSPYTNTVREATMYVGDRAGKPYYGYDPANNA